MPTEPNKEVLSKEILEAVKVKLETLDLKAVKKGEKIKLNPQTAAWSVNYST